MAYKELKKLYYGDKDTYRETYMQRFSAENAVHLDFDVAGYQAFFVQCEDVINLTYQILKLDKDIQIAENASTSCSGTVFQAVSYR